MQLEELQQIKDSLDKGVMIHKGKWLEVLDAAIEALEKKPIPSKTGWMKNILEQQPVPDGTLVEIITRFDEIEGGKTPEVRPAEEWDWSITYDEGDIMKWRVSE